LARFDVQPIDRFGGSLPGHFQFGIIVAFATVTVAEHTVAMGLALLRKLVHARWYVRQVRLRLTDSRGLRQKSIMTPSDFKHSLARGSLQRGFCLYWRRFGGQAKTIGIKPTRLSPTAKALTAHGFTLTCTGSRAIYLINVPRGQLVDEAALADALRKQTIAGVATDNFAEEPPSPADPLLQAPEDKTLFSPHIAGMSPERWGNRPGELVDS
jgi:lactate dehydrogenase-like 2-hydroxyacid dehydrogenase